MLVQQRAVRIAACPLFSKFNNGVYSPVFTLAQTLLIALVTLLGKAPFIKHLANISSGKKMFGLSLTDGSTKGLDAGTELAYEV